ncbi:ATP-dependent DNA helicase [Schizosaccharomyces cryophilus OY26]|uniref:ATP-dependent DNA helicase n=1 Tax=Schizosaccharomyces cryophilus (strain OY26 / ATCC MYA-4695 / CBS 11777 / NBRC 106824 / NRRL Y48691) TaxID=653667 RepID=S9W140_SCHCR|nr:ATP-dependent DNA helicase [Schizosaccharomyces cryophilus OY26]EPY53638.1 ATP-dependent DNA helicase [Schizosaccharomyces cryophilus OY26]
MLQICLNRLEPAAEYCRKLQSSLIRAYIPSNFMEKGTIFPSVDPNQCKQSPTYHEEVKHPSSPSNSTDRSGSSSFLSPINAPAVQDFGLHRKLAFLNRKREIDGATNQQHPPYHFPFASFPPDDNYDNAKPSTFSTSLPSPANVSFTPPVYTPSFKKEEVKEEQIGPSPSSYQASFHERSPRNSDDADAVIVISDSEEYDKVSIPVSDAPIKAEKPEKQASPYDIPDEVIETGYKRPRLHSNDKDRMQDSKPSWSVTSGNAHKSVLWDGGTNENPISLTDDEDEAHLDQFLVDTSVSIAAQNQPSFYSYSSTSFPEIPNPPFQASPPKEWGSPAPFLMQHPNFFQHSASLTQKEQLKELFKDLDDQLINSPKAREGTPAGLVPVLMEHQKEGLTWLKKMEEGTKKGGILADDMGLGKTVQMLALLVSRPSEDPEIKTTLIVAPVALVQQWRREILAKIAPSMRPSIYVHHGQTKKHRFAKELMSYDIVLTTYNVIAYEFRHRMAYEQSLLDGAPLEKYEHLPFFEANWYRVVLDEAQTIKNRNTLSARGCCLLRSKLRWCLSGTPMQNGIEEFYSLVKFLRIQPYCDWSHFSKDFIGRLNQESQASSSAMKRLRGLIKAILLRRTKSTMIDGKPILSLPPKTVRKEESNLSNPEMEFYNALQTGAQIQMRKYMQEGTVTTHYGSILVLLLRLRQACCHPWLLVARQTTDDDNDSFQKKARNLYNKLSGEAINRLKSTEMLRCSVCQDYVIDLQIIIPCGHFICRECLSHLITSSEVAAQRDATEELNPKCTVCFEYIDPDNSLSYNLFRRYAGMTPIIGSDNKLKTDRLAELLPQGYNNILENRELGMNIFTNPYKWTTSTKIDKAVAEITSILQKHPQDKILMFSQFVQFLELFAVPFKQNNVQYIHYHGGLSPAARNEAVLQFETNPNISVLLISLKAGNVGLNLTCANHVLVLDPFWNPYIEEQAIDRAHRIGQSKPVNVLRITVNNTVEERVLALQEKKRELIDSALGEKGLREISRLDTKELAFLFGM